MTEWTCYYCGAERPTEDHDDYCAGRSKARFIVIGSVEHEHYMNGRKCMGPWNVLVYDRTGSYCFHCPDCKVEIGHSASGHYQPLADKFFDEGRPPTNTETMPWPGDKLYHTVVKRDINGDEIFHCPPSRLGGVA